MCSFRGGSSALGLVRISFTKDCLIRDGNELPFAGLYGVVIQVLHTRSAITDIAEGFLAYFRENPWHQGINDRERYAIRRVGSILRSIQC